MGGNNVRTWTDEMDAEIIRLRRDGEGCTQIGKRLGKSRNAVIGRFHRLGLSQHRERSMADYTLRTRLEKPKPARKEPQPAGEALAAMRKRMKARAKTARPAPVEPRRWSGIPLVALTHSSCRYPVSGEGAAMMFCGATKAEAGPYCHAHAIVCHSPVPPKKFRIDRRW